VSSTNIYTIFFLVLGFSIIFAGGITSELKDQFRLLGEIVAYAWLASIFNFAYLQGSLNQFGIQARTPIGLVGILCAPFLHSNWEHLAGNTVPFVILGWFILLQGTQDFIIVTVISLLLGGLGVWLFGRANASHVGASGVIFGYLGFLLSRGYFEGNLLSILLSLIVGVCYGKLLWNVLPVREGMSWEGHLFGLLGGIVTARYLVELRSLFPV
jgi:membrane associated rhomboid family serine protease